MTFRATIPLGKPNLNGRIYTKESFTKDTYNVPVFLEYNTTRDYEDIIGHGKVTIKDDVIEMDITLDSFVETVKFLQPNIKAVFCCNTNTKIEDGIIKNADIHEVFFTIDSAFPDSTFEVIERIIESADICDYCKHYYNKDDACYKCMIQDGTEDMFEGIKVERLDL